MPLITLRTSKVLPNPSKKLLAEGLSLATEKILRKDRNVIVILFKVADQCTQWWVGNNFKDDGVDIFELNIAVTKGTNTDAEKAEWIAAAWQLATEFLGAAHHPNYISIYEVEETNWGYNGLTQNQRKVKSSNS
jgi:4-oxalocrotonate tautomerase